MSGSPSFLTRLRRAKPRMFFAAAVLFAFWLQALVPAGFMPDIKGQEKGVFKIVVCTAQGSDTVTLDKNGHPVGKPAKHDGSKRDLCAFGAAPHNALATITPASMPTPLFTPEKIAAFQERLLAATPLGVSQPRAPPVS